MAEVYVLDSYAVLALLGNEAGSDQVKAVLQRAQAQVFMSWVNVGEVAYIVERRRGKALVFQVLGALEATRIRLVAVGRELALKAAEIKATYPLAYADAFAAALAFDVSGTLLTGDPEFKALDDLISIEWLPQKAPGT
ncbi:MAG: PIN domain-containing protein [Anaerolineae bacterium]|nr:PIN domain-containing protein [Anaerolineae bacterium]